MWSFRKRDGGLANRVVALEAAAADLHKCCEANATNLERALAATKSARADIDLQWEKVNRALARFAKRDAVEAKADEGNGEPSSTDVLNARIMRGEPI
jgi:hypothetical protein